MFHQAQAAGAPSLLLSAAFEAVPRLCVWLNQHPGEGESTRN